MERFLMSPGEFKWFCLDIKECKFTESQITDPYGNVRNSAQIGMPGALHLPRISRRRASDGFPVAGPGR